MRRSILLTILSALVLLASASAEAASIRGKLINGTQDAAGKADLVRLMDVSSGEMDQVQVDLDVEGEFFFEDVVVRPGQPYLIQAQWDDVIYSTRMMVAEDREYETELVMYDSTPDFEGMSIGFYHALFRRQDDHMEVAEVYEFHNDTNPPVTVWRENGPILLDLPHDIHGEVEVAVNSGTLRLHQELLEDDDDPTKFSVAYPLRPGKTTLFAKYLLHYEDGLEFTPRFFYPAKDVSFLVSPDDIAVTGAGITASDEGSPMPGFAMYQGESTSEPSRIEISMSGGSATAPDPHAGMDGQQQQQRMRVEIRDNRWSGAANRALVLVVTSALLIIGIALNLQRRPKDATLQSASLVHELRLLEDRYVVGQIDKAAFETARNRLLSASPGNGRKAHHAQREKSTTAKKA